MSEVYIPIHWLHSSAKDLENHLKRLVTDLINEDIPTGYIEITRARIAWLRERIPYQKTLELIGG